MKEKLYRVRPLVFEKVRPKRKTGYEVWEARSFLGTFHVTDFAADPRNPELRWNWDHPNEHGEDADDYADNGHPTREAAIAAAVRWYELRATECMEEVT